MRICEIQSVPKEIRKMQELPSASAKFAFVDELLSKQGFERIDAGGYGRIYSYRDTKVIKVFNHGDGYLDWIAYARSNPSPWVPRFFSKPINLHNGELFGVILERLEKGDARFAIDFSATVYARGLGKLDRMKPNIVELLQEDQDLNRIFNYFQQDIRGLDLNSSNIMSRGSQPVFVDPFKRSFPPN